MLKKDGKSARRGGFNGVDLCLVLVLVDYNERVVLGEYLDYLIIIGGGVGDCG